MYRTLLRRKLSDSIYTEIGHLYNSTLVGKVVVAPTTEEGRVVVAPTTAEEKSSSCSITSSVTLDKFDPTLLVNSDGGAMHRRRGSRERELVR